MAEQRPPSDRPPYRAPPDTGEAVQAKKGGASATTGRDGGSACPNPPEAGGWRESPRYPNPPDPANPDPSTLQEQWLFATRRYSRWYSRAWGAAALAGAALFAAGWAVKGSNPLPSGHGDEPRLDAAGRER